MTSAIGPVVEWQVLATKGLKPHVGFQAAASGRPMAASGWEEEWRLYPVVIDDLGIDNRANLWECDD